MFKRIFNLKNLILFFLAVLILVPPFFNGGRHAWVLDSLLVVAGLLLFLLLLLFRGQPIALNKNIFLSPYFYWGILLLFYFVSASQSVALYQSSFEFLWLLSYAVIFVAASRLSLSAKERDVIFFLFIVAAVVLSLVGLYFYLTGGYYRLTSTFYWANPFAGYLLLILPLAIGFFYARREVYIYRISALVILPILLLAFFLTQSRGAGLILLLLVLAALFLSKQKARKGAIIWFIPIILIAIVLTGLLLFFKFGGQFAQPVKVAQNTLEASYQTRLNFWLGGLKMFLAKPFLGFGPGSFAFVYPSYQKDALSSTRYAHNYFVQMLAEGGLLATLALMGILATILWLWRKNKNQLNDAAMTGLVLGLTASILHNFVDFDWYFYANFISFWILAGLLYGFYCPKIDRDKVFNKKWPAIVGALIILILIFAGAISWRANYFFQKAENQLAPDQAEPLYHQSLFLNPNPDYYGQLSNLLLAKFLQEQDAAKAKPLIGQADFYINKAIHFNNDQPYYYQLKAVINYVQKKPDASEQSLLKAVSLDPINRPTIYLDLVSFYLTANKLDKAEQFATQILSKYPDTSIQDWKIMTNQTTITDMRANISMLYYLRGLISEKAGSLEKARSDYRQALEIDQNNQLAKIKLENLTNLQVDTNRTNR